MTECEQLIGLVQRIMDGDHSSDGEVESLVAEFAAGCATSRAFVEAFHASTAFPPVTRRPSRPARGLGVSRP
jgi:hypothetical protein